MTRDEWRQICVEAKAAERATRSRRPAARVKDSTVQLHRRRYRVDHRGAYRRALCPQDWRPGAHRRGSA